jgi:hypothetical protein
MERSLNEARNEVRDAFLGRGGIHGVGLNRKEGAIRIYTDSELGDLSSPVENSAHPFPINVTIEERPNVNTSENRDFFEELGKLLKEDHQQNPFAYVGLIVYPVNGRAAAIAPMDHYSMNREEVIQAVEQELRESEPELAEEGLKLLEQHDLVRVGRIIVQILKYPRAVETKGVSAIG